MTHCRVAPGAYRGILAVIGALTPAWLAVVALAGPTRAPASDAAAPVPMVIVPAGGAPMEVSSSSVAGGEQPARYLLVSSFVCFTPGCEYENAVLRYDAETGAYLGVHIANVPGPTGLALHPVTGNLFVACRETDEVREYNADNGAFIRIVVPSGSGGLNVPQALAFTAAGNLLVTSTQTADTLGAVNGIIEYDGLTGDFIRVFVDGGFFGQGCGVSRCLFGPNALAFGPNGNLYVTSGSNDLVIEYNGVTGAYVGYFDTSLLDFPTGLAIRPSSGIRPGNILVTSRYLDPGNPGDTHKILEFDKTTRELINPGGTFATGFQDPGPIMWADDGNLLVADRALWDQPPEFSDKIVRRHVTSGAFLGYATAIHDTHLHFANGMVRVDVGCESDADCNDANPCTDDTCDTGTLACVFTPNDANDPDDGLYCNGLETACVNGVIVRDPPPNCGDGLACTTDTCNDDTDSCEHALQSNKCLINGECFAGGALNPANQCQVCNPFLTTSGWANVQTGAPCNSPVDTDCDNPDTCDGLGTCLNNFLPPGTPCGNHDVTTCTGADTCNGAGACAPNHAPDGTECSDGLNCTEADACAGGACVGGETPCAQPELPFCIEQGEGFLCTECVNDADCPDDGLLCTVAVCDPKTHTCGHVPHDSVCDDGLFCNGGETCSGETGECVPGTEPCVLPLLCDEAGDRCVNCLDDSHCDDSLVCTGVETCVDGSCVPGTPPEGCCKTDAECDNGTICDGLETCVDNTCVPGMPLDCADSNDCTFDMCDPELGCSNPDKPAASACGDPAESICNHADTCNGEGVCQSNIEPNGTSCSDGIVCNGAEVCEAGVCMEGEPIPDCCDTDDDCDDHDICNGFETCVDGGCGEGTPLVCDDEDPCTTESCHPIFGCQIAAALEGTPCGNPNGTLCDLPDTCDGEGACRANLQSNGTPCSDGVVCNGMETCQSFVCTPGEPIPGCCKVDEDCDNQNVCDGAEHCIGNICTSGTPLNCEDGNDCTINVCDAVLGCLPATLVSEGAPCGSQRDTFCDDPNTCSAGGECLPNHAPNGTPCPDGLFCNGAEACQDGVCAPGEPIPDCCDTNADCDNGNLCDGVEHCLDSVCEHGAPLNCNDDNPCTNDFCEDFVGCAHENNTVECDNGDVCTGPDFCKNGQCMPGGPAACDGEDCTDCDHNDVRDDCEELADCDGDSTPDICEPNSDFDHNCRIDLLDAAGFQRCLADGPVAPGCAPADADLDGDVDLADWAIVAAVLTGP